MKRIFIAVGILVLIIIGCKEPPIQPTPPPRVVPSAKGCTVTISALGTHLVSGMTWTNSATGHSGSGMSIVPDPGSTFSILADPSISCATNLPSIAAATMNCQGTNLPNAIPIVLPSACGGLQGTINFDCSNCTFSVTGIIGYDCYIYSPVKK